MGVLEYRDDDVIGGGFCPRCGRRLSDVTTDARGWCTVHGLQWADFQQRFPDPEEEEEMRSFTAGAMLAWGTLRGAHKLAMSDTQMGKEIRKKMLAQVDHDRLLRWRKEIEEEVTRRRK